jgi:hypothetical protein
MPNEHGNAAPGPAAPDGWYSYAIVRVVPRVERGEQINVGVILFARTLGFLKARTIFDEERLRAFAPHLNLAEVRLRLAEIDAICAGSVEGGPIAQLPASERFHWLTSPRSTVIQVSPVHVGCTDDPRATLAHLFDRFVRSD